MAEEFVVTLAGRDSSSAHRKFLPPDYVVGSGTGSVNDIAYAGRYTEAKAEELAIALFIKSGGVAWCVEPANETLPDW